MKWLWKLAEIIAEKEVVKELLKRLAALELEVAKLKSHNSRYVTALEVLEEHKWDDDFVSPRLCFRNWLRERINATK